MKAIAAATCFILSSLVPIKAALPPLRITVSGSVITQDLTSPSDGRIRTSKIDNARIFAEFSVSPADYALTVDAGLSKMELQPKSAASGLPAIRVIDFVVAAQAIDTGRKIDRYLQDASSSATGNLFEALSGVAVGTLTFKGQLPAPTELHHRFTLNATGKDVSGSSGARAIIKMKVVSGEEFVQGP